jgi:FSR family fosmidomycin resistance protein-like MFS transporter
MKFSKDKTTILAGLTLCHTFNDFYNWVLPPLLPAVIKTFGLSHFQVGLLSFTSIFVQAVLQPTIGYFADLHRKRKALLIMGFVLYVIGIASLGLAPAYWVFFLLCLVIGIGASTYHPQSANFLSKYFRGNQGKAQGIHGIGGSLGFVLAPLTVGFLVDHFGWRKSSFLLVLPGIFIIPLIWKLLEEPEARGNRGFTRNLPSALLLLSVVYGLDSMVHSGFTTFLPTFYVEKGATLSHAGILTSCMFIAGLIAQPIGGILFDKFGGRFVFLTSFGFLTLFTFAFLNAQGILAIIFSICVGFFTLSLFPVGMAFAAELTKGEKIGTTVGLVFGSAQIFSSFSPMLVGRLADRVGLGKAFFALTAVAFLGVILSLFLPARRKTGTVGSPLSETYNPFAAAKVQSPAISQDKPWTTDNRLRDY